MDQLLIAEILTSDSDEIADLKANIEILDSFIELARKIDELPNLSKRFYEESRSLFQATSVGQDIDALENILSDFFGPPIKPAGKPLPRKLGSNSSVNYLGGIQKNQSLFLLSLKTGEFYGALWPWQRNKNKIEIHLGYCSDWINDNDYAQIEAVFKRSLSRSSFARMDTHAGGQIRGISLASFLQMAEMERSTFTLRVSGKHRTGRLFLVDGQLVDAQMDDKTGREAACGIISWDNTIIEIEPADDTRTDVIKQPLMHVLMESLKNKDEADSRAPGAPPGTRSGSKGRPPQKKIVRLERAPAPRPPARKISFLNISVAVLVVVALGAGFWWYDHQRSLRQQAAQQVEKLLAQVDKTPSAGQKLGLLQTYITQNPHSPHIGALQTKMLEVSELIEDEDYERITLEISNLEINEHYEQKAIALYGEFLGKYPNSHYADQIGKAIGGIKNLLDQYYYEELKNAARLDVGKRTEIYRNYLARYPKGRYRKDVEILIEEMGRQYLDFIKTEATQCDQARQWGPCIERCKTFMGIFQDSPLAQQAGSLMGQMVDKRDLHDLDKQAEADGNDYQKAYNRYLTYLNQHPQSSQKGVIDGRVTSLEAKLVEQRRWNAVRQYALNTGTDLFARIQRLDAYLRGNISGPYAAEAQQLFERLEAERLIALQQRQVQVRQQEEQARLQRERERREELQKRAEQFRIETEGRLRGSARYRSNGNGTVTDVSTGLTWTLLDAFQELGGCLNHAAALAYVRSLRHGGFADWRLPTASELAALHKQTPFYPAGGAEWYWTSESYVKGFHTVANIVTAKPETIFEREDRPVGECGSVRAVRP